MQNTIIKILDIDLDFFLNDVHYGVAKSTRRLNSESYIPWSINETEKFIEVNCNLNKNNKIKGKIFIHHDSVFKYLKELQTKSKFSYKFDIDHIDAHADLGLGDASYKYISEEILNRDTNDRCNNLEAKGWYGIGPGNYLQFAIACRWINSLNYITNKKWNNDLLFFIFKDFDTNSNFIQLKQYSKEDFEKTNCNPDMIKAFKKIVPIKYEPEVPFQYLDYNDFKSDGKYEMIFLTKSPGFTPKESDLLIPIISSYMELI